MEKRHGGRGTPIDAVNAGVLFAAVGQIFGRIGNLINGDIIGYRSTLPWSTVYEHPNSWACLNPATCNVPVQPAAGYELLTNLVLLALMFYLTRRLTRPGILMLVYLYGYAITQFLIFFTRDNLIVNFLGLGWGLKQAQWTSLLMFIVLLPITYLVLRYSKPVPAGAVAATYGVPQKPEAPAQLEVKTADEEEVNVTDGAEVKTVDGETESVANEPVEDIQRQNEEEAGEEQGREATQGT